MQGDPADQPALGQTRTSAGTQTDEPCLIVAEPAVAVTIVRAAVPRQMRVALVQGCAIVRAAARMPDLHP